MKSVSLARTRSIYCCCAYNPPSLIFIITNLVVDVLYFVLDPRLRAG